jgi:LmbE family N-acetylglucosaminyl deacetylase
MRTPLRLLAIFAHPDDESMGMGAALAKYAAEGVETYLVTATRGEAGWFGPKEQNPGPQALAQMREAELLAAAQVLGLRRVDFLDFLDGQLAAADTALATARIVHLVRTIRPQVVVTFGPEGDYGHPDHIAICQLTHAALVAAADPAYPGQNRPPHPVQKLYYMANNARLAAAIRRVLGDEVGIEVDGVRRSLVTWPDWAITTRLELGDHWQTARRAILCHRSQLPSLGNPEHLLDEAWHEILGEQNSYIRVFSLVQLPPGLETDLFAGLR